MLRFAILYKRRTLKCAYLRFAEQMLDFGLQNRAQYALSRRESNTIRFKATDFCVCCVKILVNPKGLTAFYALPTQKSVCFKLPAPKTVSAWMNFCFCVRSRANARQGQKCEKSPRRPILGISGSTSDCLSKTVNKRGSFKVIEFRDVTKVYGSNGTKALNNVNIKIEDGEFVFVVGASGAGKSTFLKLIMHEEKPTSGTVIVGDYSSDTIKKKQVPYYRRTMGIVFQDFRLIPKMSVYDNVAFAMRVIGAKEKDIRKRVPYILQLVGLSHKARSMPNELSGGEQQRVSLARALVNNPKLIIADEPTGNVDPEMSQEIVEMLTKINNGGTTVIMVTHEHSLVRAFPRRVIVIKNGEVVSDTPDPSHAQFESDEPQKSTDMYFFNEDVKLGSDIEDIFDSIESDNKSNPENSETPATQAQETIDGGEE